jgi:hypothetical protein
MSNIILHGGLLRLNKMPRTFTSLNILLRRSPAWLDGTLYVKKIPYYRLSSDKDNFIEIKEINDNYLLTVNKKIIYKDYDIFGYNIDVKLNNMIQDKNIPNADFFNYY